MNGTNRARAVLEAAHQAWVRMAPVRQRRRRYVRYTYGDQWSDPVTDRNGNIVTEGEAATTGGRRPLTNNLIRRLVKTVVGRYRMTVEEERNRQTKDERISAWRLRNETDELDPRTLEEFLISGIAVHHISRERRVKGSGVWIDPVPPESFFINAVRDPRCSDMELVGRLLDLSPVELVMRFSGGDRNKALGLRKLYASLRDASSVCGADTIGNSTAAGEGSFFHAPAGRCRVVEAWTLETREHWRCHDPLEATFRHIDAGTVPHAETINRKRRKEGLPEIKTRWEIRTVWHCRMLAPDGSVLDEFDSPLRGGEPPFAVKLYPLVDGDVHSLVEDVLDQQRYVNTLITMMDRMMGTAAKGVLLFPYGCKPDNITWEEVARRWADPGGIIPFKQSMGAEPHQVVTPMCDIGARDMLQTQISLFEDVSGVSNALMGKVSGSGVGVDRFESEVRNATTAVLDLIRTFTHFVNTRDRLAESI